ncbi:MAG TPA: DUF2961 domain-containing protein, partial [Acidobacteriota bacterium]|nr:DUF2961 domain-containing protein [Acidobacteriota bacterium]
QVGVQGEAVAIDYEWDAERSMHFRARWRVDHDLTASNTAVQDLPFLLARGKGVYVGTTSYILNPNDVPTSYGNWWGEGDEKIFVDGDSVPSTFGTGSEDYYNYSWSSPDIFAFPYCGQPRNDGPGNRGFVANYRWQVLDALPFQKLIRFYMELFSHEKTPELSYARIGYYYARPGAIDDHLAIKSVDLRPQKLPPNWMPAPRMGARNSRFYPAEELLEANQGTRLEEGRLWEGGKLLAWAPSPGETLSFRVPIEQSGKYRIQFVARLEASGGTVTPLWDDATVNGVEVPFDLHRPHGTLSRRLSVGEMELGEGEHRLTLRFEGAGVNVQVPVIGIDFIWVQRLDN